MTDEKPEADLAEQQREVMIEVDDEQVTEVPLEADPADVAEQHRSVPIGEEDEV